MILKKYLVYSTILGLFSEALVFTRGIDFKFFYLMLVVNTFILARIQPLKTSRIASVVFIYLILSALVNILRGVNLPQFFIMQFTGILLTFNYFYNFFKYFSNYDFLIKLYVKVSYYVAIIGIIIFPIQLVSNGHAIRLESVMNEPAHYTAIVMPAFYITFWKFLKCREYTKEFIVLLISILLAGSSVGFFGLILVYFIGRKYSILALLKGSIVPVVFSFLVISFNSNVRLRVYDTLRSMTTLSVEGVNLSTYALVSNIYITTRNLVDYPLIGTGLGSYRLSHERYVNDIVGIDSIKKWDNGYADMNKKDAGSLFLRVSAEFGLMGILSVLYFLRLCRSNLNEEQRFFSNAILVVLLLKLFREGHYFSPDIWFFITLFYQIRHSGTWKIIGTQ